MDGAAVQLRWYPRPWVNTVLNKVDFALLPFRDCSIYSGQMIVLGSLRDRSGREAPVKALALFDYQHDWYVQAV